MDKGRVNNVTAGPKAFGISLREQPIPPLKKGRRGGVKRLSTPFLRGQGGLPNVTV